MTIDEAINKIDSMIAWAEAPTLQKAIDETLKEYEKQVHEQFQYKMSPDGEEWADWSERYRRQVEHESGKARTRFKAVGGSFQEYTHGIGGDTGYEIMYEGESHSHTILLRTGILYAGTINMIHSAYKGDDEFILPDANSSLPEYWQENQSQRPFLGIGPRTLEKAKEFGSKEAEEKLAKMWS